MLADHSRGTLFPRELTDTIAAIFGVSSHFQSDKYLFLIDIRAIYYRRM